MKALVIKQPWCWLIANGLKDIENRKWFTAYRGPVLLLASKSLDASCFRLEHLFPMHRYEPVYAQMPQFAEQYKRGGIVGIADLVDVVTKSASRWYVPGQYGFVFENAR